MDERKSARLGAFPFFWGGCSTLRGLLVRPFLFLRHLFRVLQWHGFRVEDALEEGLGFLQDDVVDQEQFPPVVPLLDVCGQEAVLLPLQAGGVHHHVAPGGAPLEVL